MTDREIPPLGPLARLRAQLAGPRGYRRIDALLSAEDAPAAIAALSPNEIYELVHEVGFEDAADLIHLATPAQIQGCFDLDGWTKDTLEIAPLRPWLASLIEAGFEKVAEVWGALDAELRTLILQRQVKVYDVTLEEAPPEDSEAAIMTTPDRFFLLELPDDDESQRLIMQVVEDLYRGDPDLARHTIMAARSEPPAELEETAYRWRSGRLADLGYVDFYDALDLFRPLDASQVQIGEGTQDRIVDDSQLPMVVAQEVLGRSFLARVIAAIDDSGEAARLEGAVMVLVNKVLAAGRARPGQTEVLKRGALYATATLSLGLEAIAKGDVSRATEAVRTIALSRLFRVGYTVTHKLARLAQALAPRSLTAGSPAKELVAALCSPRPLFACAADEPPITGLRPFEALADLRRAGEILTSLTLRVALVESLGVDVVAMGQAPSISPSARPSLDDHIRTALARAVVGGAFRAEALSQGELTAMRDRGMSAGTLTPAARAAGHDAIKQRLDAAQLAASGPLVTRLADAWLDDLDAMVGGIKDAEIDPRFVEGVLVEAKRS